VGVVRRELVGNEDGVEQTALHRARHVLPVLDSREVPADLVLGMAPHSGGVAVDAVLDEAEQMRFLLVGSVHV